MDKYSGENWFGYELVCACMEGISLCAFVAKQGPAHNLDVFQVRVGLDRFADGNPIYFWHHDIKQDKVGTSTSSTAFKCIPAFVNRMHFVSFRCCDHVSSNFIVCKVIVNYQYFLPCQSPWCVYLSSPINSTDLCRQ